MVTGGTRGIGRAIAQRFAEGGDRIVVCGRKAPAELPEGWRFVAADVREVEGIEAIVAAAVELGGPQVWINNAGGSPYVPADKASPRFSKAIIDLNLVAPLLCATQANAVMQEAGGVILNIASVSGTRASPGTAAYGAAKAGLLNLTRTLAVEWAPKVRVAALTVGLVRTEQTVDHYGDEEGVARVAATVPLGRFATPRDVAEACWFLASEQAGYISGAALTLDGGGEWPAFLRAQG